jgi:hypothetical protein
MGYFREIAGRKFDGMACDFMEPVEDVFSVVTYRQSTYRWSFIFIGPLEAEWYALRIRIAKSNIISFSTDPAGIRSIIVRLSKCMIAYQFGDSRYALELKN